MIHFEKREKRLKKTKLVRTPVCTGNEEDCFWCINAVIDSFKGEDDTGFMVKSKAVYCVSREEVNK